MNATETNERRSLGSPKRMESTDMRTRIRSLAPLGGLLLLLGVASLLLASPAMADLPPSPCTWDGTTRTCHLWATTGTLTMPDGAVVPVWGFAEDAAGPAQVPGPVLIGNQDETLQVILHNELLTETVALAFLGQELLPDLEGVAAGQIMTYTFTLTSPGTFLYEAGLTPNGARQVAMGLYGALVVRPYTVTQAYEDPATAFDDEVLLVLGEVDPLFNSDPYAFAMHEYAPRYWLINGQAYPDVPEIEALPGQRILLRYVNAGLESHWMGLLGLRQQIIASDGQLRPGSYGAVAETLASGQTLDALTTIPTTAVQDARYALYDSNLILHNANQRLAPDGSLAYGGMMTFLRAVTTTLPLPAGPIASNVQVDPTPTNGDVGVTVNATLTSGPGVTAAEFFTNTLGAPGTGTGMTLAGDGATAELSAGTLASWPSGHHVFYVRGLDANGWGPVGSTVLNLDKLGPAIRGMSLSLDPTNGTSPVLLRATGDDRRNGRNPVIAAEYSIDGGAASPMTLARTDNPVTAMTATLTITTLQGLTEGLHPIYVTATDSLANLGAPGVITLTLDQSGPEPAFVMLTPDVLDLSVPPAVTHVRLDAVITDVLTASVQSPLANAEAFIGTVGPDGTGFNLFPSDGLFDWITETVYFNIPVGNFLWLAQGDHPIYVHGLDSAGNWGPCGSAMITIDRGAIDTEGPVITSLSVAPNPTGGAVTVDVASAAADPGLLSNVVVAEWFVNTDPGFGNGWPLDPLDGAFDSPNEALTAIINVSGWANGNYRIYVRALDSSGNWGAAVSVVLRVRGNAAALILADGFETGTFAAWTAAIGAVSITPEAAIAPTGSTLGMQAAVDGGAPAYVSHVMPAGETHYLASFYFGPNSTNMGTQEHDIFVGLNAGTPIFGIQYEASGDGVGYEVRAWALSAGVASYTAWYDIDDAPHKLGISWESGSSSSFDLTVDDAVLEQLAGLDTAAYTLHEIRLGPSTNLDPAASGIEYYDEFEARRVIQVYLPTILRGQ
jgi:FtsP/CotA-like multicopper oxidase with cupredoxin domain